MVGIPPIIEEESEDDWCPNPNDSTTLHPHRVTGWEEPRKDENSTQKPGQEPHGGEFFDEQLDDLDEDWVERNLRHNSNEKSSSSKEGIAKGAATGKATVLSCPGCFVQLCYQSQRHELYGHQWRAVDAKHVKVDRSKALQMGKGDTARFYAVHCTECRTEVAVQDEDQVFHFFHVLPTLGGEEICQ